MFKKLVGYVSEWINEIAFENGYWIGYAEGFEQGVKDTLFANGIEGDDE